MSSGASSPRSPKPKKAKSDNKQSRAKNYCFTIHKHPREWIDAWATKDLPSGCVYVIAQLEVCPETKKEHVQGFMQLKDGKTLKAFKDFINSSSAHVEVMRGTAQEASDYCEKDESAHPDAISGVMRIKRGEMKKQGNRTDLAALALRLQGGASLAEVAMEDPAQYIRYHGGIRAYHNLIVNRPKPRPKPEIVFIWGSPGCGKSRYVHSKYPEAYNAVDMKECWFDGYSGEDTIIFDDFEGNFNLRNMLKLLDYNPLRLPVKGGFIAIQAKRFIFTSNIPPDALYGGNPAWVDRVCNAARFGAQVWDEDRLKRELGASPAPTEVIDLPDELDE